MYRCDKCNTVVPASRKLNRVVTETRTKTYSVFKQAKAKRDRKAFAGSEAVSQANGWEIAKELEVCADCAATMESAVNPAEEAAA